PARLPPLDGDARADELTWRFPFDRRCAQDARVPIVHVGDDRLDLRGFRIDEPGVEAVGRQIHLATVFILHGPLRVTVADNVAFIGGPCARVVTRPRSVVGRTEVLPRISHCYVSSVGIASS
ncbi:MAG TPA: hypothetical protein VIK38_11730, partial [Coriobacteriia bacterium]